MRKLQKKTINKQKQNTKQKPITIPLTFKQRFKMLGIHYPQQMQINMTW